MRQRRQILPTFYTLVIIVANRFVFGEAYILSNQITSIFIFIRFILYDDNTLTDIENYVSFSLQLSI